MDYDENIIKKQIDLIDQAVKMLEDRAIKIEEFSRSAKYSTKYDEERENIVNLFKVRSIRLYKNTLSFIGEEASNTNTRRHFFVLAQVRTLLDVYARFIHLQEKSANKDKPAAICLIYQLFTVKNLDEKIFKEGVELSRTFISSCPLVKIPIVPKELSGNWIKQNDMRFANRNDLLTEELIKKYSIDAVDVFGSKKTYDIYSYFSEILHGNPYYGDGSTVHNERLWVISTSIITTAYLVELIDNYTLEKRQPRDYKLWLKEVRNGRDELTYMWQQRNQKMKELNLKKSISAQSTLQERKT